MKQHLGKVPAIERSLLPEDPSIQNSNLGVNKPQVGALLLKNSKRVECNPSSKDELDVGILSCGSTGQHSCKESEESSLGGFCIIEAEGALSVSRVLQNKHFTPFCDPTHECFYEERDCDCDGVDPITKTGPIICLPLDRCCVEAEANSFCGFSSACLALDEGLLFTEIAVCKVFT
jgi:hypothetical protein